MCTGAIACLSGGLAKNNKSMSMFVLFSLLFLAILKVWLFSESGGTNLTPKQSNVMFIVNFRQRYAN